jgi:hypothetical protein
MVVKMAKPVSVLDIEHLFFLTLGELAASGIRPEFQRAAKRP